MAPMMTIMARPSGPEVIDAFAERDELDVEVSQLIEHFEEVLDRACQPIKGPDQQDIELAVAGVAQELIQPRALGPGAGESSEAPG